MSKGFASASAQQANRPKTLEAIVLSQRLNDCFASLQDPRVERTRLHQLSDILTIAILAVLSGGNGWEDMEIYGVSKQAWLSSFLALPNGTAFPRVFERLNPNAPFLQWVNQLVQELGIQVIAIDGKNLRVPMSESGSKALHFVSAWATEHRLVLAQSAG